MVAAGGKQKGGQKRTEGLGLTPAAKPVDSAATEEAKRKFLRIDSFEGTFDFLALEANSEAGWDGTLFPTARHALMAAQFPAAAEAIAKASSIAEARKAADGESEIDGWQGRRLQVMEKILRDKFRRSAELRKRLQETGDRDLIWDNDEDGFWGAVKGRGQNQLGRILMEIRSSIQDDTEFNQWLFVCCELEDQEVKQPPVELLETKSEDGVAETKKVHRLSGKAFFKLGKMPTSAVVALHPSISREHALLMHTRASVGRRSQGIVLVDMGSKSGTAIGDRKLPHSWLMEPLRNGDTIRLGASTRTLQVKVNLASQIALLEQQERELRREANAIDADAANPLEAAKRAAKEEATVFVGNLEFETEKADLLGLFQDCGHVEECRFPGPEGTTKAERGICFVVFDSAMAARRAVGLNGEMFKGRKVKIAPASENRREMGDKGGGKGKGKDGKDKGKGKGKKDKDGDNQKGSGKGEDSRALFSEVRAQMQAEDRSRRRSRSGSRHRSRRSPSRSQPSRNHRRGSTGGRERSRSRDGSRSAPRRSRRADVSSDRSPSRGQRRKKSARSPQSSDSSDEKAKKRKKRRD